MTRYVIHVSRTKQGATATVVRHERCLPWPRKTVVGVVEWTTTIKDQGALKAEAYRRGMPHVRADQRRRGVLPAFPGTVPPAPPPRP